jgi:hypothetical protein
MSNIWISVDPSNKSGVALWEGSKLLSVSVIRAIGKSGKYGNFAGATCIVKGSRLDIWKGALFRAQHCITELGAGRFAAAINAQGKQRGYIECVCDIVGCKYAEVNVSEWRRVVKEHFGVSWPKDSARCKALSRKLVKDKYGLDVTDDESDAALIGLAAQWMMMVEQNAARTDSFGDGDGCLEGSA